MARTVTTFAGVTTPSAVLAVTGSTASTKAWWYLTRATGVVCLLLLTASVVLGVIATVRWSSPSWPRYLLEGLHRNVSLLVVAFLTVHIATSVVDSFAPISWLDSLIPFRSAYRPLWLGLGAVAADLLLAVVITSVARVYVGYRAWKAIHWAAYASWPVALVHGLGTGTDTKQAWMLLIAAGCVATVLAVAWWRLATGWPAGRRVRVTGAVASLVLPVLIAVWVAVGPLRPGWARAAGTPSSLLGGSTSGGTP